MMRVSDRNRILVGDYFLHTFYFILSSNSHREAGEELVLSTNDRNISLFRRVHEGEMVALNKIYAQSEDRTTTSDLTCRIKFLHLFDLINLNKPNLYIEKQVLAVNTIHASIRILLL